MRLKLPFILLFFLIALPLQAENKNDIEIKINTKDIPGARAKMTALIHAPSDKTWLAVLDFNNQAGKYPRLKRSFCIQAADTKEAQKQGLRNGFTVWKQYSSRACDPYAERKTGKKWSIYIFQEFDYPFPISDRWVIAKMNADESGMGQGVFRQRGILVYGHQKVYEVSFVLKPHPKSPKETFFEMDVWIDPGGVIMDWMVKEAAEYIAPRYMEILEQEARKR